jgi:hypothetical protein
MTAYLWNSGIPWNSHTNFPIAVKFIMKLHQILLMAAISTWLTTAQSQPAIPQGEPGSDFVGGPIPEPERWPGTPIDWSSTARQYTRLLTNILTGEVISRTSRIIEVGNGLNYVESPGV